MPDEPCDFCGYPFDQRALGPYGCPNCHGEGLAFEPPQTTLAVIGRTIAHVLGLLVFGMMGLFIMVMASTELVSCTYQNTTAIYHALTDTPEDHEP